MRRIIFTPQPDITVQELAKIVKDVAFFDEKPVPEDIWNALSPGVRRHLVTVPNEDLRLR